MKNSHWNSYVANASFPDVWRMKRNSDHSNSQKFSTFPDIPSAQAVNDILVNNFFPPQNNPLPPPIHILFPDCSAITPEEVTKALVSSSNFSALGLDTFPVLAWKAFHHSNKLLLPRLLTPLFQYGIHSKSLKHGYKVVLSKPGKADYTRISLYHIIVLPQTVSKILERIVIYCLTKYACRSGLIHPHKCRSLAGPGLSIANIAMTLIHKTKSAQAAGLKVSSLFLDIKGGFDNVVHSVLADTFEAKNTPPYMIQWIMSFLSNHSCTLLLTGGPHSLAQVCVGVPQDCSISLLLFVIYIAPLHWSLPKGITLSYVDDFSITVASKSHSENARFLSLDYDAIAALGGHRSWLVLTALSSLHWKIWDGLVSGYLQSSSSPHTIIKEMLQPKLRLQSFALSFQQAKTLPQPTTDN